MKAPKDLEAIRANQPLTLSLDGIALDLSAPLVVAASIYGVGYKMPGTPNARPPQTEPGTPEATKKR